jgi:alpha-glucosidase (family GH31 glycosyl hydrolase)
MSSFSPTELHGTVHDPCEVSQFDETAASCYWDTHRAEFAIGVDGWWPDEGDPLDAASRLVRNRMYWEGPQIDRPNQRPYALHRNGYAGMQRYGSFLWSGDVYSTWETLKTHIPVALNTALSGIPYWGTKGATSRRVYLPPAVWYDFWTGERQEGGLEFDRAVDIATLPLYVRAGSILPLGPVKQYVDEKIDAPLLLSIFPGADASFLILR